MQQILPFNKILKFQGSISRADSRRRIELSANFKKLFQELNTNSKYIIEVGLSKELLLERMKQLIEEEQILPSLIYFCKK